MRITGIGLAFFFFIITISISSSVNSDPQGMESLIDTAMNPAMFGEQLNELYKDLDLTDEQKAKVAELQAKLMKADIECREEIFDLRFKQEKMKYTEFVIKEKYEMLIDDIVTANINWRESRLDFYFSMKEILNSDQWDDFSDVYFDILPLDPPEMKFNMMGNDEMRMPDGMRGPGGMGGGPPGGGGSGFGGRGMGGGFPGMRGGFRNMKELGIFAMLYLSRDQEEVILKILDEQSDDKDKADDKIEAMADDIESMYEAKQPDRQAILKKIQERELKKGEWERKSFTFHSRIMHILTETQKTELYTLVTEMMDKMKSGSFRPGGQHRVE